MKKKISLLSFLVLCGLMVSGCECGNKSRASNSCNDRPKCYQTPTTYHGVDNSVVVNQ